MSNTKEFTTLLKILVIFFIVVLTTGSFVGSCPSEDANKKPSIGYDPTLITSFLNKEDLEP